MRIAVVGGGVIGLSIAWLAQRRGHTVRVHDPAAGRGTSRVAAGMLGPLAEAALDDAPLSALLRAAADAWPAFAGELSAACDDDLGYRRDGTLVVGVTADDVAELARRFRHGGGDIERLDSAAVRALEPGLDPRARGGRIAGDHQVDPRRVLAALTRLVPIEPTRVDDPASLDADVVVLATGATALAPLPLRAVHGAILRLHGPPVLRHVVRGLVDGDPIYLVPRADGTVLVGATSDDRPGPPTAAAVRDLLAAALTLCPALSDHAHVATDVGARPTTPDNRPIIGRLAPGVLVATGHHRHGVLLAPATARVVVALAEGSPVDDSWRALGPARFAAVREPPGTPDREPPRTPAGREPPRTPAGEAPTTQAEEKAGVSARGLPSPAHGGAQFRECEEPHFSVSGVPGGSLSGVPGGSRSGVAGGSHPVAVSVFINGERHDASTGNLAAVATTLALPARGVAIAVNGELVPRPAWSRHALAAGDRLEILTAAQGG